MRALVLSGGGSKGAYQVGAIRYLTEVLGLSWGLVSGVSVGALNGSFISQYPTTAQTQGGRDLETLWKGIKGKRSIYRKHTLGHLGTMLQGGLFSTKPLKDMIYGNISREALITSRVRLQIGAISCTTGEFKCADELNEKIHDWIIASSAFPVAFPAVEIEGDTWTDGGFMDNAALTAILEQCEGVTEIDYISTEPVELPSSLITAHVKVNLYCPKADLGIAPLAFDPKKIQELMDRGWIETSEQVRSISLIGMDT
jgi:NTE family protein